MLPEVAPVARRVLGNDHELTLSLRGSSHGARRGLRRRRSAGASGKDTAGAMRRVLGPDHPDTCTPKLGWVRGKGARVGWATSCIKRRLNPLGGGLLLLLDPRPSRSRLVRLAALPSPAAQPKRALSNAVRRGPSPGARAASSTLNRPPPAGATRRPPTTKKASARRAATVISIRASSRAGPSPTRDVAPGSRATATTYRPSGPAPETPTDAPTASRAFELRPRL